jgi:exodeoxyribonuclease VII small subunit
MGQKEAARPGRPDPDATDVAGSPETAGGTAGSTADDASADIASMSYERARDELVDIVARLENGEPGLEESMGLWQRGEALAAHCASWLDRAEARISAED